MSKLKELQDSRAKAASDIKALADKFNAAGQVWQGEDEAAWTAANESYDKIKADLDAENKRLEKATSVRERLEAVNSYQDRELPPELGRENPTRPVNRFGNRPDARRGNEAASEDDKALALQGWFLQHGDHHPPSDEHYEAAARCGLNLNSKMLDISLPKNFNKVRNAYKNGTIRNDLSVVQGSKGAYTFGESFISNLEQAMLAFGGILQVADVIRTDNGEPLVWPSADDTGNSGEVLGEGASVGSSVDPTFAAQTWYAHKFSSKLIKVPYELFEDSAFDLPMVLSEMLGTRLGRIQNTRFTTGLGNGNQPRGIVTAAVAGVTTVSATAIAFDEIIDLEHSLDPSRRAMPGVGYMFHDTILKAVRKLKDGEGRYLWQAGANTGAPDTLNTKPYTINQDMASSVATTNVTMLFGQFSQYKVRQVNQIRFYRLTERYRDTDQDGFIAFIRGDGNLLNAGDNPVKKMTQA